MVAYSFQSRFVVPIAVGLGIEPPAGFPVPERVTPKRHTIRKIGLRRHAVEGQQVQLYTAQRTKHCLLIGRARCAGSDQIDFYFHRYGGERPRRDWVRTSRLGVVTNAKKLDAFARSDGFDDWKQMREFWGDVAVFRGTIIYWTPL